MLLRCRRLTQQVAKHHTATGLCTPSSSREERIGGKKEKLQVGIKTVSYHRNGWESLIPTTTTTTTPLVRIYKTSNAQCNCSPPADWCPACSQAFPQLYVLSMMPYGMECPLGQLGSAVLAMSPHNFCMPSPTGGLM